MIEHWPLSPETVQQLRATGWSEAKIAASAYRYEWRLRAEDYQSRTGCTMREAFAATRDEQATCES